MSSAAPPLAKTAPPRGRGVTIRNVMVDGDWKIDPRVGHYVYALTYQGVVLYVGKGSGPRLKSQMRDYWLDGHIVEVFKTALQAYRAEVRYIKELCPALNQNRGGGGSGQKKRMYSEWRNEVDRGISKYGSRGYVARELLKHGWFTDPWYRFVAKAVASCPVKDLPALDLKINQFRPVLNV